MADTIRVERLSKTFESDTGRLDVLDGLTFTVDTEEFVVLVGPSGCGKTTLLKIIAGIDEETSGEIYFNGKSDVDRETDSSMVFQDFVLPPWKSVLENVALGLKVQRGATRSTRHRIAREWIDKVGLDGFEDSYPRELSGGMKQRVGLARALAVDPDVLLMDEPFASLDAQTKDRLQTELLRLWSDERKTVLFVTHDIDEAIYMADRILVLSERPTSIVDRIDVDIERPRWDRRIEIEKSEAFTRIKSKIRRELGLTRS